jgi:3,2-trans-enoyl-CoA isomerase
MNTIQILEKDRYAILQLNRGKVNAINHEMVLEIRQAFKEFTSNKAIEGVIITGTPHFFSAGLDVIELYSYDREKINHFFSDFGGMFLDLVTFKKPLISAITGYAPAGGCVIAIACDYRIMAAGEKYTIGLNEVAVHIQISNNLINSYAYWIGKGLANTYILSGTLLKVEDAKSCGLVDKVVALEEVLSSAESQMNKYLSFDHEIFINTKQKLRKEWLEGLEMDPAKDLAQATELWWKPSIRSKMKAFVESLQKR